MRILGIDYGDARIGIAVSDPLKITAQGLDTIFWDGIDINSALDSILVIIKNYKPEKVIVGMPLNMNGTHGPRAQKTKDFIRILKERINLPVIEWDERLSSKQAKRIMHETKVKVKDKKKVIDKIAAVFILQSYLDYL